MKRVIVILITKPTRCANFSNLVLEWNSTCFGQSHCPSLGVQSWTHDDGQRYCPKHIEFHSKNKFEKLAHPFVFVTRIYHDARSSECQIRAVDS